MPACLPPLVARAAADERGGLAALHGGGGGGGGADVFPEPEAVGALVDLSGKKWAHTVRCGRAEVAGGGRWAAGGRGGAHQADRGWTAEGVEKC